MSESVGSFLKERRRLRGSQQAVAEKLTHVQITQSRLSEIEGNQLVPDRVQEHAIADVLGFTAAERVAWNALIVTAEAERRARLAADRDGAAA